MKNQKLLWCVGLVLTLVGCASAPAAQRSVPTVAVGPVGIWTEASPDQWVLAVTADWTVTVAADRGARIASVRWQGREILTAGAGLLEGSTFWAAPQKDWAVSGHWPPPAAWDAEAFTATTADQGRQLVLLGATDEDSGMAVEKRLRATEEGLEIVYRLANHGQVAVSAAPWEVTRVPAVGTVVFPVSDPTWTGKSNLKPTLEADHLVWYRPGRDGNRKLFRDGVDRLTWIGLGVAFTKLFPPTAPSEFAPGEADTELYAGAGYTELESQGPYRSIAPGDGLDWRMVWQVRAQPKDLEPGSVLGE